MAKIYVEINTDGTYGFYIEGVSPMIPSTAIEISQADYDTFFSNNGAYGFSSTGILTAKVKAYVLRNGVYLYDYQQTGDTVVTEKPVASNIYTSYMWGTIAAIAGSRHYALANNFAEGATVTINGQTFTATAAATPLGDFIIGSTLIESVQNLVNAIIAEQAATPIYDITIPTTPDGTFAITEINAGGGNTPSEAICTGTGIISSGTATVSTPNTKGWIIDKATSLDLLNAQYTTEKQKLHESHSAILLSSSLTDDEIATRTTLLKAQYKTLHDELITKQGAL